MRTHRIAADGLSLVIHEVDGVPHFVHFGSDVAAGDIESIARIRTLPTPGETLHPPGPLTPIPDPTRGWTGRPGIEAHRPDGRPLGRLHLDRIDSTDSSMSMVFVADDATVEVTYAIADTLTARLVVTNDGDDTLSIGHADITIPLPGGVADIVTLEGRWSKEFQPVRRAWPSGTHEVASREGRPSHDVSPTLFLGDSGFGEHHGEVIGVHLAWSGNHRLRADRLGDGRRFAQAGELLVAGEVVLEPGDRYDAPAVIVAHSPDGLTAVSQRFHRHARRSLPATPRPILINTWEAVYFDHDLDKLKALATTAASVGVERFVLDDGWFGSRRHDRAGLGDWWVSRDAHPSGLEPLIGHVTELGMEFGIWVEPEMVNPDSDLFRAHPEWVLGPVDVVGRNQLVLDLTNDACRAHLFEHLDRLLSDHDISYVKWDHNRDIVGVGAHGQTLGFYTLLDKLRDHHPTVEFESCASGGGRIDLEVLTRTERVWTSDCNDAHERQRIQRGYTHVFPLSAMGAHIGPPRAHTTGRTHRLAFRAATALFGHLGIEWNLLDATAADLAKVRAWLDLHKRFRPLLHNGDVVRLEHPDDVVVSFGVVDLDSGDAIFSYAQLGASAATMPVPWRLAGIDPDRRYRLEPLRLPGDIWGQQYDTPRWLDVDAEPTVVSGATLCTVGLQLPVLLPDSAFLVALHPE